MLTLLALSDISFDEVLSFGDVSVSSSLLELKSLSSDSAASSGLSGMVEALSTTLSFRLGDLVTHADCPNVWS